MIILLLNILLVLATIIFSIYTVVLQLNKRELSKSILIITLILLVLALLLNPFTLISDYLDNKELVELNKIIENNLDSTKTELEQQIFTLKDLSIDLKVAVYPKKIPTLDDFTFIGERGIFLSDSLGNLYPLVENVYFMVPALERKWFVSSGKFEANRLTGLLGKPVDILGSIMSLKIPMEHFAVGKELDSAGFSIRINVNGICFYDFENQYKDHLKRAYVQSSNDTIVYDISSFLVDPRGKLKLLMPNISARNQSK
jgi:hypothetical protein